MEDNETMSVGGIGAGRMGYALIERLLDAGYDVSVYNRTRSKADPLAERGAKLVDTAAQHRHDTANEKMTPDLGTCWESISVFLTGIPFTEREADYRAAGR
jgi:nucleoside-diphosphate-sugar epimerase